MSTGRTPLPELRDLSGPELSDAVARRLGTDTLLVHEVVALHAQTLLAAAEWDAPEVLAEQLRWERARLAGAAVTLRYDQLHEALDAELQARLAPTALARLRDVHGRADAIESERPVAARTEPLAAGAAAYLTAALAGDLAGAATVVREALARGATPAVVIREVLQPAQVEIGRRWEAGEVSVPQEHRATGITSRCMALFSEPGRPLGPARRGSDVATPRMVAATIGAEGHELGLRMLSEVVGADGWDVDYLGSSVPAPDLLGHVEQTRPDVLALSVTLAGHVSLVADVVSDLRASGVPGVTEVKVLVGGRAFASRPDLAGVIGADGWAPDADTALALCHEWFPPPVEEPDGGADSLGLLAERYRIDPHHVSGALDLLAAQSGLTREELAARLDETP